MSDSGETLPSPAPAAEKRGRGRPRQSTPETLQQRLDRAQTELKEAQAAMKLAEDRRASIAGHAAIRHARHHTEFARQFAAALRAEVRAKADQAAVADLMREPGPPDKSA